MANGGCLACGSSSHADCTRTAPPCRSCGHATHTEECPAFAPDNIRETITAIRKRNEDRKTETARHLLGCDCDREAQDDIDALLAYLCAVSEEKIAEIGREICEHFAGKGYAVRLCDLDGHVTTILRKHLITA